MLEMSSSKNVPAEVQGCKDRFSNSTQAEEFDQCSIIDMVEIDEKFHLKSDPRLSQTLGKMSQKCPISRKLIQKSVNFLLKAGYIKNLNFETILHSICLFYNSLTQLSVSKANIECILCACLLLSCKLHEVCKLSLSCVVELINHRWSRKQIIKYQSLILQQLDFDLHFKFPLINLLAEIEGMEYGKMDKKQVSDKVQYLAQILLIQQPNMLYDAQNVLQVYEIAKMDRLEQETETDQTETMGAIKVNKLRKLDKMRKIRKIIEEKKSLCDIVVNKYRGKFDIAGYCGLNY